MYGLNEVRAWESDYRSSHQDTGGLMDYMPLIIVGAIVLLDCNEVQVEQLSLDSDLGVGLDHDFADASLVDSMQSDMGGMEVDAFQADLDAMTTDIDTDFGGSDGFDVGGSSFDSGSMGGSFFP